MHLILTYLSVIMLLGYVSGSKVQDLYCTQGRIHNNILTFGVGNSDKLVSTLRAQSSFKCTLKYSVKSKNYIMLVLEFPEFSPKEKVCVSRENSTDLVTVSDYDDKKSCQYNGSEPVYRSLSLQKATLQLDLRASASIKVTTTTMRDSKNFECLEANETYCTFTEKVYCMTSKVACDGYYNCGLIDLFDEDISTCKGRSLTSLMKITSLIMGILTIFLFGSICLTILPKRKGTFVHKVDETIPSFDSESEIASTEVDVQILFSDFVK